MDLWNNEIVSHALSSKRGDRMTYISGLQDLIKLRKQYPECRRIFFSAGRTSYFKAALYCVVWRVLESGLFSQPGLKIAAIIRF